MGRALVDSSVVDRLSAGSSQLLGESSSFRELDDVFLQTQTRIWLGEVLHTRLDEETAIADLLADGKILFQVSKVVWKMLLKKCVNLRNSKAYFSESNTSGKSSGRYMPYSNVDSFLKICQTLGLTGIDLLSPSDVVEKRDIRRVCMCIRSLSKKARLKDLNVPDFDVVTYTVAMPTDMVECIRKSFEYPKKTWGAEYARQYDSYSEESDDAEINYRMSGFHSPASTTSCSETCLLTSDVKNLLGQSSMVSENFMLQQDTFHSDVQHEESYMNSSFRYSQVEAMGSLTALCLSNDNHQFDTTQLDYKMELNAGNLCANKVTTRRALCNPENETNRLDSENRNLGTSATYEQNFLGCQLGNSDINDCGMDNDKATCVDGFNLIYKTPQYLLGMRYPNVTEEPNTSHAENMTTVCSEVDAIDYEDKFEVEGNISSSNIVLPQDQGLDISVDVGIHSISCYEFQERVGSLTTDIDKLQFCINLDDSSSTPISTEEWRVCATSNESNRCGDPDLTHRFNPNNYCYSGDSWRYNDTDPALDDAGLSGTTFPRSDVSVRENLDTSVDSHGNRVEFSIEATLPIKEENYSTTVTGASCLKQCDGNNISLCSATQIKNTLKERVASEEGEHTVSPSDGQSSVAKVNESDVLFGDRNNSFFGHSLCSRQFSSVDSSCCELVTQKPSLGELEEKPAQPSTPNATESGDGVSNVNGQSEGKNRVMRSTVNSLGGLEDSDLNICDTYTTIMVDGNTPVVHHGGCLISFPCVSSIGSDSYIALVPSENAHEHNGKAQHLVDEDDLRLRHQESLNQEDISHCVDVLDKDTKKHEEVHKNTGQSERRSNKAVLLKSFAGGVSLLGVFFLLFQFRRPSNGGKIGETTVPSVHISQASREGTCSQKEQEKHEADGVYPGGKLKF